jgi:hypothetical protein
VEANPDTPKNQVELQLCKLAANSCQENLKWQKLQKRLIAKRSWTLPNPPIAPSVAKKLAL